MFIIFMYFQIRKGRNSAQRGVHRHIFVLLRCWPICFYIFIYKSSEIIQKWSKARPQLKGSNYFLSMSWSRGMAMCQITPRGIENHCFYFNLKRREGNWHTGGGILIDFHNFHVFSKKEGKELCAAGCT